MKAGRQDLRIFKFIYPNLGYRFLLCFLLRYLGWWRVVKSKKRGKNPWKNLKERKRDDEGWQDFYLYSNFYLFTHGQQAAAALYDLVLLYSFPFVICYLHQLSLISTTQVEK
jgi:hypothetical protein